MAITHGVAANLPRWRFEGKPLFADRIYHNDGHELILECGARVELTDDLKNSGPAGYGDFWTRDEDGGEKLYAGAVFQVAGAPIPHALDVVVVSADIQPGRGPDMPSSGDPADPLSHAEPGRDPIADSMEKQAAKESEQKKAEV